MFMYCIMGKNFNLPSDIRFSKSKRTGKKYKVTFKLNGEPYTRHFGSSEHEHFKDRTPLKLYSHLDHGDKERRARYYLRHGFTNNPTSAKYWSNWFLW